MKFKQYLTGLNEDAKSDHKTRVDFADEAIKQLKGELKGYLDHYFARLVDQNEYCYAPVGFKIPFKVSGMTVSYDKNGDPKEGERIITSEITQVYKKENLSAIKTKSGNVYVLVTREAGYQKWLESTVKYSI